MCAVFSENETTYKMKVIVWLFVSLSLFSCHRRVESEQKSPDQREFYENGNIRRQVIILSDTTTRSVFYNKYDSGKVDSSYNYRRFQDVYVPWEQFIDDQKKVMEELDISIENLDSGTYVKFLLLRPQGEWLSIWHRSGLKDTTYRGTLTETWPRQIYVKNNLDSVMDGYAIDWRVWSKTDTSTTGLQYSRYLKFTIPKRNPRTQGNIKKICTFINLPTVHLTLFRTFESDERLPPFALYFGSLMTSFFLPYLYFNGTAIWLSGLAESGERVETPAISGESSIQARCVRSAQKPDSDTPAQVTFHYDSVAISEKRYYLGLKFFYRKIVAH